MSSISPRSFIDDGASFHHRLPPTDIREWLRSTSSDTTSAYTGSFIDDGADMLLPCHHRPGFGAIDARFYKNRKRREDETGGVWNEDIARAVGGDIGRNLGALREVGDIEVRRRDGDNDGGEDGSEDGKGKRRRREGKRKDTVTVPLPRRWGTIVIKDEGGRVVVVDEDGEFDSGVQNNEMVEGDGKWINALPTISEPGTRTSERKKRHRRRKERTETLVTIPESEYEEVLVSAEAKSDMMSPTGFFMTGGAGGWLSPNPSSVAYSSDKPYSKPKSKSKSEQASPVRSLPGSWPSPPQSPTKGKALSDTSTDTRSSKQSSRKSSSHRSHRSGSSRSHTSSRNGSDHASFKTYSAYKPATVEDAPVTSSDNATVLQEVGRQDNHKGSEVWGSGKRSTTSTSSRRSSKKSWNGDAEGWGDDGQHHQPTAQDWTSERVKTVSGASSHAFRPRSESSHTPSEGSSHASRRQSHHSHTLSEVSWDGYERPKTESEVSVVGSDSERSWPGSRVASRQPRASDASRPHSRRSSRHGSQAGWGGSDGWGGSQTANVDGWGGEKMDSGSGIGRSDIDETSDEGNWSDLKIKIRSRRGNVKDREWN